MEADIQCILSYWDIWYFLAEGKLEYKKTEEGVELPTIPKLPYEVESPKSSPEPLDFDNDSNASSTNSTGFSPVAPQVPTPPDITPLILNETAHTSITIGGQTIKIPISSAQSIGTATQIATVTVAAPHHFAPSLHAQQPSHFGANRNHRRTAKQNRPKQQAKQRVIKFHEYKGPSANKTNNLNNNSTTANAGSFVTTTGPIQNLEGLTPYEVRVQQQQLYLQCQLEVQSHEKAAGPAAAVLVPIRAQPHTPLMQQHQLIQQQPLVVQPPTPLHIEKQDTMNSKLHEQSIRSRPTTPSLALKSPPLTPAAHGHHNSLHISRSLSHLEELKVADLKQELKQRHLTVSGSKPQLIERLRMHQLQQEMSSKQLCPNNFILST